MVGIYSFNPLSGGSSNNASSSKVQQEAGKLLSPTLKLDDPVLDTMKFQQDHSTNGSNSSRSVLSNRILHPGTLTSSEEISYKVSVANFADLSPLKLGSKYITDLIKIDSMTPSDLYSHSHISKDGGLDNYYFDNEKGLGDFSRFEKISQLNLPDKFFDEYNSTEVSSKMGLFPEIDRSWIVVDNKLILWNYKQSASSSSSTTSPFLTIDSSQIKHSVLQVKLVRPKPKIFVDTVSHLLVIATSMEIQIFIVKYDASLNNLEIFNPDLVVSTQGLLVNNIIVNPNSGDIYFTGEGDGVNVWRLDYSNKSSFTKNKCDKVCMTKSGFTSVLPYKIPGTSTNSGTSATSSSSVPETIIQLDIDASRNILYTLSNKSIIRVYQLQITTHQESFTQFSQITPTEIFKGISSLFNDVSTSSNFESFSKFRIMSIQHITSEESSNIQMIAITNFGCRILLRLGSTSSFPSFALSSSSYGSKLKLSVSSIKFPPSKELPKLNPELDSFTRDKQYLAQLVSNQRKSQLLKNTKFAKILSPGVFLCVKRTKFSDKLFVCTSNYGFLKKNSKLVEDAEFVKIGGDAGGDSTYIHDIIQLTPSMNATKTPNGYANVLATQYTKKPLQFAVLTNFGIHFYQFRTPDQILKGLGEETLENFMEENGYEETCSTLLYLGCSYGNHSNDMLKTKAHQLFATCGNNARLPPQPQQQQQQHQYQVAQVSSVNSHPTIEQVILSDRFYGTCLLVSRLFRDYWNSKVFVKIPYIRVVNNQVESGSIKDDNLLIQGLNIDKRQVEFFIGSIIVLIDFFIENGNNIQGLNAPNYSSDPSRFSNEVCLRAEHIAFTSILKSLNSIKEALSFVMVLIEEIQINQTNFNEILKFLSVTNQINLLSLTFKDLLLPNIEVKNLIKDLLSSIINKNILKGGSIDSIATSLQGRCGSFCSTNDVFIFKAIENLTRAKSVGGRDNDLKVKCLNNAVILFEEAYESLTLENIENSVNIMVDLEYYTGAVRMCLSLAHRLSNRAANKSATAPTATASSTPVTAESNLSDSTTLTLQLYKMIFSILTKIDLKAIQITGTNDQLLINDFIEIRDSTYETCFSSKDKNFHYEFYQWFINQGVSERLLEINTPFILPFLEEKSKNNLVLTDLLWLYHAKRENYYAAANILYALAISEFNLKLQQRIEYLSRANGFCNCVCPPNVRQKMIQLSSVVGELFEVANVQLDVLNAISQDDRISKDNKELSKVELNYKILTLSDLFNSYTDPLGYYDLCLIIFKISDYKNTDDILKRWEFYFEKLFHDFLIPSKSSTKEPFYITLANSITSVGIKLSNNDLVFPVEELVKLVCKYIQEVIEESDANEAQIPPVGAIVDIFIKSGVSYDKLYYIMKSIIEHNSSSNTVSAPANKLISNEMIYLIKNWYSIDKKVREFIPSDKIKNLSSYSVSNDPINEFVKANGIRL
ncbi:nucleoporin Nup170p [[Candida] railenensis]|uniref:Nucleoporin Nup170p n=1 Tax=[Candida] railenensis TaxID=45579 RepID=A0A9P0QKN0_9ASCO|nr:nucleoporin Nup170p [[Candida] railenensis]